MASNDPQTSVTVSPRREPLIRVPAPSAHPDAVYAALSRSLSPKDRSRRHQRKAWISEITVWVLSDDGDATALRFSTLIHDISYSGLCFVHPQSLSLGSLVRIRFDTLDGHPVLDGRIVNCIYVGAERNRIGVEFHGAREVMNAPVPG